MTTFLRLLADKDDEGQQSARCCSASCGKQISGYFKVVSRIFRSCRGAICILGQRRHIESFLRHLRPLKVTAVLQRQGIDDRRRFSLLSDFWWEVHHVIHELVVLRKGWRSMSSFYCRYSTGVKWQRMD